MTVKIRRVEKIAGAYGNTKFPTNHKAIITVSKRLNRSLASYAATILHELLHVWVHILAIRGFELDEETEHNFIYAAERAVLVEFRKVKRGRKS